MIVVGIAFALGALMLHAHSGPAYACSCVEPGSPTEEVSKFDAVFAGTVFLVHHSYDPEAMNVTPEDRTTIGFEVSAVWKGVVHETTYITTPPTGGSCGFRFVEGEEYIVYASDSRYGDDSYTASICSRTALLSAAQADLDALSAGQAPQTGTMGPVPIDTEIRLDGAWLVVLLAGTVLLSMGIGGFVAYGRARLQ